MLGSRGMAGLIVPANNSVILPELYRALPEGVTAYESRMAVEGDLTFEVLEKMIRDAKSCSTLLRQTGVGVIGYCCMGSSVVKGWGWEDALLEELAPAAPGGATSANRALLAGLTHLGARCVSLVTPYPESINALLPAFFAAKKITVKEIRGIEVRNVRDVRHLTAEQISEQATSLDLAGVDAVCLLATDMETMSVIARLEAALGIPVLSNNQALLWQLLRMLGVETAIPGYGRLLAAA